ncbi:MAG: nicotinate-nucleotide adenylyltransferase [Gaiellales bacterium]
MRLGVFGGEFDPPHIGHLVICQEARFRLELDRLLVIPAGRPPHRATSATPAELRFRLTEVAFAGEPDTEVSRIELDSVEPSYTVRTLERLAEPDVELFLIMGADQFAAFATWREPMRIRELARLAVAARPGARPPRGADVVLTSPMLDVSSTEIRRRMATGQPVRHLVPDPVLELLAAEGRLGGRLR